MLGVRERNYCSIYLPSRNAPNNGFIKIIYAEEKKKTFIENDIPKQMFGEVHNLHLILNQHFRTMDRWQITESLCRESS